MKKINVKTMRRFLMILAVVFAAFVFTGCEKCRDVILKIGEVSPSIPDSGIPIEGGEYTVAVVSNAEWDVVNSSDGCEAVKDGDDIKITVAKNSMRLAREVVVTVAATVGGATAVWGATQEVSAGTDLEHVEPGVDW